MTDSLDSLLRAATDASPSDRIEFRDRIAAHGAPAIDALGSWLDDPRLGAFAVRVIERAAGDTEKSRAASVLRAHLESAGTAAIRSDIEATLVRFGPAGRARASRATTRVAVERTTTTRSSPRAPREPAAPRATRTRTEHEIVEASTTLRDRPAIRYRIKGAAKRGHFDVPRAILDELGVSTDGYVFVHVRRAATGATVFEGPMPMASGTEIYPRSTDKSQALRSIAPGELLDITVAKAGAAT